MKITHNSRRDSESKKSKKSVYINIEPSKGFSEDNKNQRNNDTSIKGCQKEEKQKGEMIFLKKKKKREKRLEKDDKFKTEKLICERKKSENILKICESEEDPEEANNINKIKIKEAKAEKIENENKTLFVKSQRFELTKRDLIQLFWEYGKIKDIRISRKGFAFVEFYKKEFARNAFNNF